MDARRWKLLKRSGGYRRKIRKAYENIQKLTNVTTEYSDESAANNQLMFRDPMETSQHIMSSASLINAGEGSAGTINLNNYGDGSVVEERYYNDDSDSDHEPAYIKEHENKCDLRDEIRKWALKHNVCHAAVKDLLQILNKTSPNTMPNDPRTLLKTPRTVTTTFVDPGEYWHNGLKACIVRNLENTAEIPKHISIIVNIDGLPVHKSSKQQFWPILCSIFEKPDIKPIICGIYLGSAKPKDLNAYLSPFLDEMSDMIENGVEIQNQEVQVTLRCFVCDSPARAMIKGVCNFNGKHGCLKCTVIGEYSHISHTVIFPGINCPLRNDKDFRDKKYGNHHKVDSPLLKLPIDMIEAFPVADSLHLIDLGIMKRLLIGWRDGNFGKKNTKWRASDIQTMNIFLNSCKTPTEIHRAVRGWDCLSHWKGSEYRTFFHYLSVAILPTILKQDAMQHFLTLFCAITICSSEKHFQFLSLADDLLKYFVTHYKDFYGVDYVTSNVHNLSHVVDEVRHFGKLETFNAYKFENKLYTIKNMLRQGNKPLVQVAKRLGENERINEEQNVDPPNPNYPYVKKNLKNHSLVLYFKDYILSTRTADRCFLTLKNEIMQIASFEVIGKQINIYCKKIDHIQNVFELPISSSYLNIFKSKDYFDLRTECVCSPCDVKCKLVVTNYQSELYFVPLLHTL